MKQNIFNIYSIQLNIYIHTSILYSLVGTILKFNIFRTILKIYIKMIHQGNWEVYYNYLSGSDIWKKKFSQKID